MVAGVVAGDVVGLAAAMGPVGAAVEVAGRIVEPPSPRISSAASRTVATRPRREPEFRPKPSRTQRRGSMRPNRPDRPAGIAAGSSPTLSPGSVADAPPASAEASSASVEAASRSDSTLSRSDSRAGSGADGRSGGGFSCSGTSANPDPPPWRARARRVDYARSGLSHLRNEAESTEWLMGRRSARSGPADRNCWRPYSGA